MSRNGGAGRALALATLAFTLCFAVWTIYGVLVTFLVDRQILVLDEGQIGWLIGIPILTGSLLRLPVGILTDRYGGKPVLVGVMALSAIALFCTSFASSFAGLMIGGLTFGICGAGFPAGVAYCSIWFPKEKQGTALGIFGLAIGGSALTSLGAPRLLAILTLDGTKPDGWRLMVVIYAAALMLMTVVFSLFAPARKADNGKGSILSKLKPLGDARVWRFGLYYFVLFGGFVALAQWLIPYYLNVYGMSLATAGLMASCFSLPSGLVRALGGVVADKIGARTTMYWAFSGCALLFLLLVAPRMDISSPGQGVQSKIAGQVTWVSAQAVVVEQTSYPLRQRSLQCVDADNSTLVWPTFESWQQPSVSIGQTVKPRELIAKGVTHVFFQANPAIFSTLVFVAAIMMGMGMGALYKHIPDYFPNEVGVVGGLVGVIGGFGGFVFPLVFGWMLKLTGLWTSCWFLLAMLTIVSLVWMHMVILRMAKETPSGFGQPPSS